MRASLDGRKFPSDHMVVTQDAFHLFPPFIFLSSKIEGFGDFSL